MKYRYPLLLSFAIILASISCRNEADENTRVNIQTDTQEQNPSTNVIVFLIPGMDQDIMSLLMRDPNANFINTFNDVGYYAPKSYFEDYADLDANATALMSGTTTLPGLVGMNKDSSIARTWLEEFDAANYQIGLITDGLLGEKPIDALFPGAYSAALPLENTVQNMIEKKPEFIWGIGRQLFDRRTDKKLLFDQMGVNDYHLNFDIRDKSVGNTSRYAGLYYYYDAPDTIDMISEGIKAWYRFVKRQQSPAIGIIVINSLEDRLQKSRLEVLWKINRYLDELAVLAGDQMNNTLVLILNPFQKSNRRYEIIRNDSVAYTFSELKFNQTHLPVWASGKNSHFFRGYYDNTDLYGKLSAIAEGRQ